MTFNHIMKTSTSCTQHKTKGISPMALSTNFAWYVCSSAYFQTWGHKTVPYCAPTSAEGLGQVPQH